MNQDHIDWYSRNTIDAHTASLRWRYYYKQLEALLHFVIPADARLVQIGSGDGDLLSHLNAKEKVGIDCSKELISNATKKHPTIEFIEDDFWNLRTSRTFDYALISEVTDSLRDVEIVLKETRKLINDQGRLVVVARNYWWQPLFRLARLLSFGKTHGPFKSLLKLRDLENLLYVSGFEVVIKGRGILMPVYIPLISAFFNRFLVHIPPFSFLGAVQYVVARPFPIPRQDASVSLIVAARNEKGNIENIIKRIPDFGKSLEIVIVEGNSSDGTWEEMQRVQKMYAGAKQITLAKQDGKGKWDAVKKGFSIATGELLIILDADMTVPPEDMPRFYNVFAEGRGDFVNGSRRIYPMEKGAMRFLNTWGNRFFAIALSIILRQRFTDTLCGTKVIRKSDYERIASIRSYFGKPDPFGDFELLFGASKLNLKITELPIRYMDREYGEPQISRFKDGFVLLKLCVNVFPKFIFRL